jgi:outer membrane protein assembly factor BamA
MPSPFAADVLRFAAFVDAGQVSAPGAELLTPSGLRFTPGAGARFLTPVGPFRLDVAYNPYPRETGPLYIVDPEQGLLLGSPAYRPESPGFLRRLRVQFALGQAF